MKKMQPKVLLLDVDGVLTDGTFFYTAEGKVMKKFGPDDTDALSLLKGKLEVQMISGDKRGFEISKKRIDDMKYPISLVSTFERLQWIEERYKLAEVIYMGDGIYDTLVLEKVGYGIAPANAFFLAKEAADYVTKAKGGEGAVAEAVVHLLEKFFEPLDLKNLSFTEGSGAWGK